MPENRSSRPEGTWRPRSDRARQVADVLRQQIADGAFGSGMLPDERVLVAEFATTRNAVRDALDVLRAEGLIVRRRGVGTQVVARKYGHGLHRLSGLAETLHEQGTVVNDVRVAAPMRPPAAVAARLGIDPYTPVVYLERLRLLGDRPLSLDMTYLAADIGTPLLAEDLRHHDVFALIEQTSGSRLGAAELAIQAVNADARTAEVLEIDEGAAVFAVERLTRLACGRPVDLEMIRIRGDRLTLHGDLHRSR
ncbi:GntR family transcriptional regulator [Saccharopolyspora taberi]|uniref:GntR family transcriptional regulator n=1 Tax=Saccharopolyspora taberi TaxID=60895 RepID=A0ABN3VDQ4_9PSEU